MLKTRYCARQTIRQEESMRTLVIITITFLVSFGTFRAFANEAYDIKELSQTVNQLVQKEADTLDEYTAEKVSSLLLAAKKMLSKEVLSCMETSAYDMFVYGETYNKIKHFAEDHNGLGYYGEMADAFVLDWMQKYPCDLAEIYNESMIELISFAYGSDHLNMFKADARDFALNHIDRLCTDVDYKKLYNKTFYYAYSLAGLNMSKSKAHDYTRPIVFKEMFGCSFPNGKR